MYNWFTLIFIGIQFIPIVILSQISSGLNQGNWKPNWDLYFGPSLVNYQIITIEDQASWTNPLKSNGTPKFDFGYNIGLDFYTQVSRKWLVGLGSRLQLKGGKYGYAVPGSRSFQFNKDDQFYLMIMIRSEYFVSKFISLYNGFTFGYPPDGLFEKEFQIAILTGLKFKLPKRWSIATYYNQDIKLIASDLFSRRRFYSFDLSLFYRLNSSKM